MSKELAIGHFLTLYSNTEGNETQHFQNFYINEDVEYDDDTYSFLPFGFGGITISRSGDNVDANLVFPNNDLSRDWSVVSIRSAWVARIRTMRLDPSDSTATPTLFYDYTGQISEGGWDNTTVNMTVNSVLNAVSSNIPHRVLEMSNVGYIPTTTSVRV